MELETLGAPRSRFATRRTGARSVGMVAAMIPEWISATLHNRYDMGAPDEIELETNWLTMKFWELFTDTEDLPVS